MCTSAVTPCCARQARAQCSGQPSMARMGRPELALLTSELTRPPTPAMQDISASPARSRRTARVLASCATLEQPEQEYTSGRVVGLGMAFSSGNLTRRVSPLEPSGGVDGNQEPWGNRSQPIPDRPPGPCCRGSRYVVRSEEHTS